MEADGKKNPRCGSCSPTYLLYLIYSDVLFNDVLYKLLKLVPTCKIFEVKRTDRKLQGSGKSTWGYESEEEIVFWRDLKRSCLTIRERPQGEIDQLSLQTANRPCFIRAIQLSNDIKVVISALCSR